MEEDKALITSILDGDNQAFRMLIKQNERLVAHMVGRLVKNREEMEELCQDVFLKVYDKLGTFTYKSRLSTWIAAIAYRMAINHLKKKKMVYSDGLNEVDFADPDPAGQEKVMEEEELDLLIIKLTDKLPPQYKTVLLLFHVDGMSYTEIVKVTGLPEGTVKNYIFRARKLLKDIVIRYLGKEELI
jgi:RNA polymerase sigma factor (sigma-70 family)